MAESCYEFEKTKELYPEEWEKIPEIKVFGGNKNNNSDIINANGIYLADSSNNMSEGIHVPRDTTHWDSIAVNAGNFYFAANHVASADLVGDAIIRAGTFKGGINVTRYNSSTAGDNVTITENGLRNADANEDGSIDISDNTYISIYIEAQIPFSAFFYIFHIIDVHTKAFYNRKKQFFCSGFICLASGHSVTVPFFIQFLFSKVHHTFILSVLTCYTHFSKIHVI